MKISKISLLAGLLFAATQSYCMDPAPQVYPLEQLPAEMENKIYDIVVMTANANTFEEAAQMINSLALTNKEFNARVNDPEKLFYIIKHLAKKFNAPLDDVMVALGGRNALEQSRFNLTKEIRSLNDKIRLLPLEKLSAYLKRPEISKNIDLNYLDNVANVARPLHYAVFADNDKEEKVRMLLNAGANPNLKGTDYYAKTPLQLAEEMAAANPENKEYPKVIKLLKEYTK